MSKSRCYLDLDQTMPNVELVRAIFIYYLMLKFHVDKLTHTHIHTHTHTHTHMGEYSIVAVDKPQLQLPWSDQVQIQ